jgi:hypothetical protein
MNNRHAVRTWYFEAVVYTDNGEAAAIRLRVKAQTELYARRKVFDRLRSRGFWVEKLEKHPRNED